MKRASFTVFNFSFFVLVSFYSIGTGLLESLFNYPSWYLIGPTDAWLPYRDLLNNRIVPLLAVPALLLQMISNVLVIIYRPALMPRWTAWSSLLLLIIGVVSSFVIQIPIQAAFQNGYDKQLLDKLISSDLYLRVLPGIIRVAIILHALYLVMRPAIFYQSQLAKMR